MTSRQLTAIAMLASVVSVAFLATVFTTPDRDLDVVTRRTASSSSSSSSSSLTSSSASTSSTIPTRDEVVTRLREILRIREEAYRSRRAEMLATIYSIDCPCMASDQRAIEELLNHGYVWDGISTSIEVRSVSKVSDRLWLVVALFRSGVLSIKTEHGKLMRVEPAGSDLFEFTLVKPSEGTSWLLGLASVLDEG
jgi:hypothetical protein